MSEALRLDLSRQKLYVSPDDPLPKFHPPPSAILVTPIYDTPVSGNGPPAHLNLDQPSPTSSRPGPPSPWIVNRSSDHIDPNAERYHASSSRRHDDRHYGYPDQRYDSNHPHYPEHSRDHHSHSYPQHRSRRRPSFDYDDSSDNGRRDDSSDHDRSSDYDYSSENDHAPDYDRSSSDDDRSSADYDRPSSDHHRPSSGRHHPSSDYDHSVPAHHTHASSQPHGSSTHHQPQGPTHTDHSRSIAQHHNQSSSQPHGSSAHHEPEERTHTGKKLSKYFERNRQVAHRDPFRHLKNLPEEIQRVLKAIPPSPHFCWSECTGNRKAVCVGVNYTGQHDALKGCANDARSMRSFLMKYHRFESKNILLLTDDGQATTMKPTRKDMFNAMSWLVKDAKKHDSLFFHYSGHGGQVTDKTGTEADGKDEVIFPVDFKSTSYIPDNDLFKALVEPLPTGCRLTAVFDSCHSGTILDLPYLHSCHGRLRSLAHITLRARQRSAPPSGDVICFAACKDDETSADTFQGGVAVGAMSYALLKILKADATANTRQTYKQILEKLRAILIPKYSQKAQLSGTHPVDLDREFSL